jgi:hypothetical protein
MRQLQPDGEVEIGVGAEAIAVRADERVAQARDRSLRPRGQDQLVRIRAAVVLHGDRLASPNQFGAARAEPLPAAGRQRTGLSVDGAVPALHRQDAEAVAGANAVALERPCEGRRPRRLERRVKRDGGAAGAEVPAERVGRLQ